MTDALDSLFVCLLRTRYCKGQGWDDSSPLAAKLCHFRGSRPWTRCGLSPVSNSVEVIEEFQPDRISVRCFQGPFFFVLLFVVSNLGLPTTTNLLYHDAMNPKPYWILRHHKSTSIRSLHHAHNLLAIGDDSGVVSLVDLLTLRPKLQWTAHSDSILTVIVILPNQVVTHARDNTLKLWSLPDISHSIGTRSSTAPAPEPTLVRTIGVNALNFSKCSFSAPLVAVPNALDAAYIDILDLRTGVRVNEAIGRPDIKRHVGKREAIVMSLHLLDRGVIAGYEDGYLKRWTLDGQLLWHARCHSESVMAMSVGQHCGVSVAADDRLTKFNVETGETQLVQTRTPGNASVAISPDAKSIAIGAWSGSIDVYSATDPLTQWGSLGYHRDTVECLTFAHVATRDDDDDDDHHQGSDEDEMGDKQVVLAAGGRDGKVSLWKYH